VDASGRKDAVAGRQEQLRAGDRPARRETPSSASLEQTAMPLTGRANHGNCKGSDGIAALRSAWPEKEFFATVEANHKGNMMQIEIPGEAESRLKEGSSAESVGHLRCPVRVPLLFSGV
jgi:hypothetical protein